MVAGMVLPNPPAPWSTTLASSYITGSREARWGLGAAGLGRRRRGLAGKGFRGRVGVSWPGPSYRSLDVIPFFKNMC
jgi:hypothetical protein